MKIVTYCLIAYMFIHTCVARAMTEEKYENWMHVLKSWVDIGSIDNALEELIFLEGAFAYDKAHSGLKKTKAHEYNAFIGEMIGRISEIIEKKKAIKKIDAKKEMEELKKKRLKQHTAEVSKAIKDIENAETIDSFIHSFIEFYRIKKMIEVDIEVNPSLRSLEEDIRNALTAAEKKLALLQKNSGATYDPNHYPSTLTKIKDALHNVLQFNKKSDYRGIRSSSQISIQRMKTDIKEGIVGDKKLVNLNKDYQELEALEALTNMGS